MQLETALYRLKTLVEHAAGATTTKEYLVDLWQEIDVLLTSTVSPALEQGGSLPLGAEKKEEIKKLISEITVLEQKLQLKGRAINTFTPTNNGGDKP